MVLAENETDFGLDNLEERLVKPRVCDDERDDGSREHERRSFGG